MGIFCPFGAKYPHFLLLFSPFPSGKGARGIGLSSYDSSNIVKMLGPHLFVQLCLAR